MNGLGTLDEQQLRRFHDYLLEAVSGAGQTQQQLFQLGLESKERQAMGEALKGYQAALEPREVPYYPREIPASPYGPQMEGRATVPWGTVKVQPSSEQRRIAGEKALTKMLMFRTPSAITSANLFARALDRPDTSMDFNEVLTRAAQGDPIAQRTVEMRTKYEKSIRPQARAGVRYYQARDPGTGKMHEYMDVLDPFSGQILNTVDRGEARREAAGGGASVSKTLNSLMAKKQSIQKQILDRYKEVDLDEILRTGIVPRRWPVSKTGREGFKMKGEDPNDPRWAYFTEEIPEVRQWLKAIDDYEARAEIEGVDFTPAQQIAYEKPQTPTAAAELPALNPGETKEQYIKRLQGLGYTITD